VLAAFAVGLHGRGGAPLTGFAILVVLGMARDAYGLARGLESVGNVVPFYICLAAAFAGGHALQRRELLVSLLGVRDRVGAVVLAYESGLVGRRGAVKGS
jgi:hypothetical protein